MPRPFSRANLASCFVYTPTVCLRPNFLTVHLWSRPQTCHYYFGDYYGASYLTLGYRPWFQPIVANRPCYDSLFTYYSWQGCRVDRQWNTLVQQRHDYCVQHQHSRPPRTWHDLNHLHQQPQIQQVVNNVNVINSPNTAIVINNQINNTTINQVGHAHRGSRPIPFGREANDLTSLQLQNASLAANVQDVAKQLKQTPNSQLKLVDLEKDRRQDFMRQGQQVRQLAEQRQKIDLNQLQPVPGTTPLTVPGNRPGQGDRSITRQQPKRMQFDAVKPVVIARDANPANKTAAQQPQQPAVALPTVTLDNVDPRPATPLTLIPPKNRPGVDLNPNNTGEVKPITENANNPILRKNPPENRPLGEGLLGRGRQQPDRDNQPLFRITRHL